MVWATGWNNHANEIIAPLHGLPALPVVDLAWSEDLRSLESSWKLPLASEYVEDRACVWIDDHVRPDVEDWAWSRTTPTLVLRADHRRGLCDELVEHAIESASRVAKHAADVAG